MDIHIQKLINSDYEILEKFGWLLYNREDQNAGLSQEEVYELMKILNEDTMEKEYRAAYEEGMSDGICE
ncbi:hypothetical protein NSS71_08040 [Niallia sp. FSL W8-0951]|uniref:hypothetical protein n=1 Tax=Niallia sp. FSL W8-0951 TaxID=2954639 RepID=UPI0030F60BB3